MERRGLQFCEQLRQVHNKRAVGVDIGDEHKILNKTLLHQNDAEAKGVINAGVGRNELSLNE